MQVDLYDRCSQQTVSADILPMTDVHYQQLISTWIPSFQERYRNQLCDGDFSLWQPNSSPLDWSSDSDHLRAFVLTIENSILGILYLRRQPQTSRLLNNEELVYVRYVATAPWNRPEKSSPGRLRGVGSALMDWAIFQSLKSGLEGRIGLHSLRGSDPFYERLSFRNLGSDPAHWGMTYFERPALSAVDDVRGLGESTLPRQEAATSSNVANVGSANLP